MRSLLIAGLLGPLLTIAQNPDSAFIREMHSHILTEGDCYEWLEHLCTQIGPRLAGSPGAAEAVDYTHSIMHDVGFDSLWLQPLMVPHWVRGDMERARVMSAHVDRPVELTMCALGGSIGTGLKGVTGQVVEVHSFEGLRNLPREEVEGNIVFFNIPMNQEHIRTFHAYGETARYRVFGADSASKKGAVAMILRSLSTTLDDNPHTGVMIYRDTTVEPIPGAALSTVAAVRLSEMLKQDPKLSLTLYMSCETLPDELSYNVIGEIRGSDHPEEILVVGGHLDAWDNGQGAHDDGAGCVQSIQVAQTFNALGYRPKRTVRVVMFMNEENGSRGGKEYARVADSLGENHVFALESDAGAFTPRGIGIGDSSLWEKFHREWIDLFEPYDLHDWGFGGGGVDINPLKAHGCAVAGLRPDSQRYFDLHHAPSDTFDKINHRELKLGAAAMASLIYLVAEHGVH